MRNIYANSRPAMQTASKVASAVAVRCIHYGTSRNGVFLNAESVLMDS